MCLNYLQVLEWNWNYYNGNTKYYNISYKHCHGPLLVDILKCIPLFGENHTFLRGIRPIDPAELHKSTLLFYVMPVKRYESYIPEEFQFLINTVKRDFMNNIDPLNYSSIHYFLCKYFWEAKLEFKDCDVVELNKFIQSKMK